MATYYVEPQSYCSDYVEGDIDSLSVVLDEIDELKDSVEDDIDDLQDLVKNELTNLDVNAENISSILLAISNRLESLETSVDAINQNLIGGNFVTSVDDSLKSLLTNFMTKQDLLDSIPMVDDKSLMIYPKDTKVINSLIDGIFNVESSRFLPTDNNQYTVVYTVSKEINGVKYYSDFAADYLKDVNPEEWVLKTDCEALSE